MHAAKANLKNGVPVTNADKRHAATTYINYLEKTNRLTGMSCRKIADNCGLNYGLIHKILQERKLSAEEREQKRIEQRKKAAAAKAERAKITPEEQMARLQQSIESRRAEAKQQAEVLMVNSEPVEAHDTGNDRAPNTIDIRPHLTTEHHGTNTDQAEPEITAACPFTETDENVTPVSEPPRTCVDCGQHIIYHCTICEEEITGEPWILSRPGRDDDFFCDGACLHEFLTDILATTDKE
jgi:hypothetical protein